MNDHDPSTTQPAETPDRFRALADLFLRLRDLPEGHRRDQLEDVAARDPDLANQLELMLDASAGADEGSDEILVPVDDGLRSGEPPKDPEGYRIIEPIGTGSAGDVYLAEQTGTIERRVAMKVLSFGTDARGFVERFEAERKTIASMEHRGIARVFDAGTLPDGRPFFTMEYLEGGPITTYADRHSLRIEERIDLFRAICEAVQHAHQRGVLHLDLKPSNIMMDGNQLGAQPRVIDFGIATAMSDRETLDTQPRHTGSVVGSPPYMSPEHGTDLAPAVDTRSDVYALGVLLSELLTGTRPHAGNRHEPDWLAIQSDAAGTRALTPNALRARVRGDLTSIIRKCTEADPDDRYASPRELSDDLGLHLGGFPVRARLPSTPYLVRTFVSRHRWPVTAGMLTALALIGLIGVLVWGAVAVRQERDEAIKARLEAQKSAATAEALNLALSSMIAGIQPSEARGRDTSLLRELVERSLVDAERTLVSEPIALARLRVTLGRGLTRLGEYARAVEPIRSAIETFDRLEAQEEAAFARLELAFIMLRANRVSEAEELTARASSTSQRFPQHSRLRLLALLRTCQVLGDRGDYRSVRDKLVAEEAFIDSTFAADDQDVLALRVLGATAELELGHAHTATALLSELSPVLDRVLGADHPQSIRSRGVLAQAYALEGRYEDSLRAAFVAVEGAREVLGEMHPDTLLLTGSLANALRDVGRTDEAIDLYAQLLEQRKKVFGVDSSSVTVTLNNFGALLRDTQRFAEAAEAFSEAASGMEAANGPSHPHTLIMVSNYADVISRMGDAEGAMPLHDRAVGGLETRFPDGHWWTGSALIRRAESLLALGRQDEAHGDLLRARALIGRGSGPAHERQRRIDDLLEKIQ